MGMRRAKEDRVDLAWTVEVVGVAAAPGEEAAILLATR
jgi:hypothetical protein